MFEKIHMYFTHVKDLETILYICITIKVVILDRFFEVKIKYNIKSKHIKYKYILNNMRCGEPKMNAIYELPPAHKHSPY